MDHMVFGSMISLDDLYQYHRCPVVLPIPFLSADKSIYEFGFLRRLLNGKKVLRYLARNLFMVKRNPFWERNISKTIQYMFTNPSTHFGLEPFLDQTTVSLLLIKVLEIFLSKYLLRIVFFKALEDARRTHRAVVEGGNEPLL